MYGTLTTFFSEQFTKWSPAMYPIPTGLRRRTLSCPYPSCRWTTIAHDELSRHIRNSHGLKSTSRLHSRSTTRKEPPRTSPHDEHYHAGNTTANASDFDIALKNHLLKAVQEMNQEHAAKGEAWDAIRRTWVPIRQVVRQPSRPSHGGINNTFIKGHSSAQLGVQEVPRTSMSHCLTALLLQEDTIPVQDPHEGFDEEKS